MTHIFCLVGRHKPVWAFIGDSWMPDLYIRVCERCGIQLYDKDDK